MGNKFRSWIRSAKGLFNGGRVPLQIGEPFRTAHRNMLWIGTVLWVVAWAHPSRVAPSEVGNIHVPGVDLYIDARLAAVALAASALYFWWQFLHELDVEILKACKIGVEAAHANRQAVEAEIDRRQWAVSEAFEAWKQGLEATAGSILELNGKTSAIMHAHQLVEVYSDAHRFLDSLGQEIGRWQGRSSESGGDAFAAMQQGIASLQNRLRNAVNAAEVPDYAVVGALNIAQDCLREMEKIELNFVELRREVRQQTSDFRKLDERLSGGSKRKFVVLDRVFPQLYTGLGMGLCLIHWIGHIDLGHMIDI